MNGCSYTYMLRCVDGTLYTGWTNDLSHRVQAHNDGAGAKYTKSRLPVELVYYEEYEDKRQAQQREYAIKQLSREQKELLIGKSKAVMGTVMAIAVADAIMQGGTTSDDFID